MNNQLIFFTRKFYFNYGRKKHGLSTRNFLLARTINRMNFPGTPRKHSSRVFLMNSCNNSAQGLVFHNAVRIPPSRGAILLSISQMIARYRWLGNSRCIMLASDSCLVHEASKLRNLLFHDLKLAHY